MTMVESGSKGLKARIWGPFLLCDCKVLFHFVLFFVDYSIQYGSCGHT